MRGGAFRSRVLLGVGVLVLGVALMPGGAGAQSSQSSCTVKGTVGNDRLMGTKKRDVVCGRGGDDRLIGRGGNDELRGGTGNDVLEGGIGGDRLLGKDGNDSLKGAAGNDQIMGEAGDDDVDAGADADVVDSGDGADWIRGGSGEDRLSALAGDDEVFGGDGDDLLFGGDGDDRLDGGAGSDQLDAGPGLNVCVPGGPSDVLADNCVDTTPPTITGVEVSPSEIDTSLEPGRVLLRVRGDDDLSGLASAKLWFDPPGEDSANSWSLQPYNGSDPALEGTLQGYVYLGQLTGSGDWDLIAASARDRAGNEVTIQRSELDAIGAPASFHQFGELDETKPELLSVSVTPRNIDTSSGSARVTVTIEAADSQSGIGQASVSYRMNPNLTISDSGQLISGTRQRGVWQATYDVPRWTRQGEIPLQIELYDRANNGTVIDAGSVDQAGEGDTTPPALADLQITPQLFSTVGSDQTVKLRFRLQDDQAGVTWGAGPGNVLIMLQGPGGIGGISALGAFPEAGGSPSDGWWTAEFIVPRFSPAGTWAISLVTIIDDVGNSVTFQGSDLTARGFPTSFSNLPG